MKYTISALKKTEKREEEKNEYRQLESREEKEAYLFFHGFKAAACNAPGNPLLI